MTAHIPLWLEVMLRTASFSLTTWVYWKYRRAMRRVAVLEGLLAEARARA